MRSLALAHRLAADLAGTADVEIGDLGPGSSITVTPHRAGACSIAWLDFPDEIVLQVGEIGGRWELGTAAGDLTFLEDLVTSVIAGRVTEVFAYRRTRVTVTMPDGSTETETGYDGLAACLPLPLWPRWARTVHYRPYL